MQVHKQARLQTGMQCCMNAIIIIIRPQQQAVCCTSLKRRDRAMSFAMSFASRDCAAASPVGPDALDVIEAEVERTRALIVESSDAVLVRCFCVARRAVMSPAARAGREDAGCRAHGVHLGHARSVLFAP